MKITRLEIFGFKSFVDRFVLDFDKDWIGIVGPNGCGKSNIVDALRWVLGETHAKQLRGSVFDDLIFNGSESRRPLGMAEVSITVRPAADWKPALSAISGREQSSDNGNGSHTNENQSSETTAETCLDSVDLEQPTVEEETESSQNNGSLENLLATPGLLDSAEIQLTRRLYRSGESEYFINKVPCRLRDMTDFYRVIGLGARGLSIVQQGTVGQLVSKKPVERRELLEEAAGISGFRSRMEAATRKLEKTETNVARLTDIIEEVEKQLKTLRRQAKRARERHELKQQLKEADSKLFLAKVAKIVSDKESSQQERSSLLEALEEKKNALLQSEAAEESLRSELEEVDVKIRDARQRHDELLELINAEQARDHEFKLEQAELNAQLRAADTELTRLSKQSRRCAEELEQRQQKLSRLEQQLEQSKLQEQQQATQLEFVLSSSISQDEESEAEVESELESIGDLEPIRKELRREREEQSRLAREVSQSLSASKAKLSGRKAELETRKQHLHSLQKAAARFVPEEHSNSLASGVVLSQVLKVAEEYEQAVSALLGERLRFLVADKSEEIIAAFEQGASGERLGVVKQQHSKPQVNKPDGLLSVFEVLEVEAGYEHTVESVLVDTYLVDSLSSGLSLVQDHPQATAVTRDGVIITDWGWYRGNGDIPTLGLKRSIEELEKVVSELESKVSQSKELEAEFSQREENLRARSKDLEEKESRYFRLQRTLSAIQSKKRKSQQEALQKERSARQALERSKVEIVRISQSIENEQERIELLEQQQLETAELKSSGENVLAELVRSRDELNAKAEKAKEAARLESERKLVSVREEVERLRESVQTLDRERDSVAQKRFQVAKEITEQRREIEQLSNKEGSLRLSLERVDIELRLLLEDMQARYGEEVEQPSEATIEELLLEAGEDLTAFTKATEHKAGQLRRRLEREGEVDPESIEMCKEEEERLESLQSQKKDLEAAIQLLRQTIHRLKVVSKERFLDTFNSVKDRFATLLPRLFGGGAGHLELINPEDPLTSGVELTVRPPGKKPRSIELLSGGEKALAATAILIAMFLHRPSPICVLDEVDAPLDDANLDRFLELIREISHSTQFLMITHNKQSMASVDKLIGITMQESGVSTALEVDLAHAEQELERRVANS